MSQQAFADFYEKNVNGPGGTVLRARIEATKDTEEFLEVMVQAGRAAGVDFSEDDVRAVIIASDAAIAKAASDATGELADQQLESVAGGLTAVTQFSGVPIVKIRTTPNYVPSGGSFSTSTIMCQMIPG